MRNIFFTLLVTCLSYSLFAQYQMNLIPRSSPDKGLYHKIGYTEIEINYGSPKVNGRVIWGDLLPYDEFWRAGANVATTISISEAIIVEGKLLPKGRYAFFVIPRKSAPWTVIFSNKPDQWGAFGHKKEEEVLRLEITPEQSHFSEELNYRIFQKDFDHGTLTMDWENIRLNIHFETSYLNLLSEQLANHLNKASDHLKWVLYLQASEYLLNQKKKLDLALEWINKSEELSNIEGDWNPKYYPKKYLLGHLYWTKAKLLALKSDYENALTYADKMKKDKMARSFYLEENEFENIDDQIKMWNTKVFK